MKNNIISKFITLVMTLCVLLPGMSFPLTITATENQLKTISDPIVVEDRLTDSNLFGSDELITGGSSDAVVTYNAVDGVIGLKNDTKYYIMNYSNKRLLSLHNSSDANNTYAYTQLESIRTPMSQWMIQRQSDGRYQLISVCSPTSKVLNVSSGMLDIYSDNNSESQQFVISRINEGQYKGLYHIQWGQYYVTQGQDYYLYLYTSPSDASAWSFMEVEKGYADFVNHNYYYTDASGERLQLNTAEHNTLFYNVFSGLGYAAYTNTNCGAAHGYDVLCETDVFVYAGHGCPGAIIFSRENNVTTGAIVAHNVATTLSNSYEYSVGNCAENQLASLRCAIYMGCNTGTSYSSSSITCNLVDITFEKGAHFVLGVTETIYYTTANDWNKLFFEGIQRGYNIQGAMDYADDSIIVIEIPETEDQITGERETVNELPCYWVGDVNQYLN